MQPKILYVCVIYNQLLSETRTYNSLLKYADSVLIIDNSYESSLDITIQNNWHYISLKSNPGISKAYNIAAKYAKINGFEWILLADQDTYFPLKSIDFYKNAICENHNIKLFCPKVKIATNKYMSPVPNCHYNAKLSIAPPSGLINPLRYAIINSGLLINIDAFFSVGGYNDKVWLDFADFQFVERFAEKYDKAYVLDIECSQSFSDEEQTIKQKLLRYNHFCTSLKNYEPINSYNKIWIDIVVLKRAISLCFKSKGFSPIITFIRRYVL